MLVFLNFCIQVKNSLITSRGYTNVSYIDIRFDQTVGVTEHYYPDFSVSEFLSSFGGVLGLWLGVGVVQLTGFSATFMKIFLEKLQMSC